MPKLGTFTQTRNIPWTEEAKQFSQMAMMAAQVIGTINKQKEEKLQQETEKNLKILDLNFKIMSDKNMPESAKLGAYKSIRDIGGKNKLFELPELTSWTDPYNTFGKKGAGIFQSFLKGDYDKDTALNAFAQLSSEAQDKESLEAIKPFRERVEALGKERAAQGIAQQMQPQQIPTGEPDISKWGGVPMAMPQKTMTQEPDYEKILASIPPDLKDAPVVKMLEEKIKAKQTKEPTSLEGILTQRVQAGEISMEQALEMKSGKEEVEVEIRGQKVKIPTSVYVAHLDREASREQAIMFHQDNLAMRKQLADMTYNLRTRLPASQVKDLNDKQATLDRYGELLTSFDNAYGGKKALGPTMTSLYERVGAYKGRVNWWKEFRMLDNQIRHEIFGATLTGYEKKSWDAVTVSENSDPKIIRDQVSKRLGTATNALQRQVEGFGEAGYNVSPNQPTPQGKPKKKLPQF